MSSFKDFFSQQASDYSLFRPTYPAKLFSYLASLTPEHESAWDCATGNGQAAVELAQHYAQVIATDASEKQIREAVLHPKIKYCLASAEDSKIESDSLDLITVAQAYHWFDQPKFLEEAKRVLKPGGVLAIWCYALTTISPEVDRLVLELYSDVLGPYWDSARRQVEEHYSRAVIPWNELKTPSFTMTAEWDFAHLIGYLGTWSALKKYESENRKNPLEIFFEPLRQAWGDPATTRRISWPLGIRVFQR